MIAVSGARNAVGVVVLLLHYVCMCALASDLACMLSGEGL